MKKCMKSYTDLKNHGCDVVTLGQYLQPTKMHIEVAEFIHPDKFAHFKEIGFVVRNSICRKRTNGSFFLPCRKAYLNTN
jgi:lipoate synthase